SVASTLHGLTYWAYSRQARMLRELAAGTRLAPTQKSQEYGVEQTHKRADQGLARRPEARTMRSKDVVFGTDLDAFESTRVITNTSKASTSSRPPATRSRARSSSSRSSSTPSAPSSRSAPTKTGSASSPSRCAPCA